MSPSGEVSQRFRSTQDDSTGLIALTMAYCRYAGVSSHPCPHGRSRCLIYTGWPTPDKRVPVTRDSCGELVRTTHGSVGPKFDLNAIRFGHLHLRDLPVVLHRSCGGPKAVRIPSPSRDLDVIAPPSKCPILCLRDMQAVVHRVVAFQPRYRRTDSSEALLVVST